MLVILTPVLGLSIYLTTHLVPFPTAVSLAVSPFYDKSSKIVESSQNRPTEATPVATAKRALLKNLIVVTL